MVTQWFFLLLGAHLYNVFVVLIVKTWFIQMKTNALKKSEVQ